MTEAISSSPQFSDKTRRALLLAGDRSLSKVKESGAYFITIDPNKEGDLNQEYWDIAVYLLSAKKKSEAVIKALQTRNKKLEPDIQLNYDSLQDIKDLAYTFIETVKEFDPPEEDGIKRHLPYFERDGKLYLTCISAEDRYSYAHLEAGKVAFSPEELDPMGMATVPPELPIHQDRGTTTYIVGLPRSDLLETSPLLSPDDMYARIRTHFYKYFDAPEAEYELFVYYALYSWYFSKCSTTPYLRLLGDTGKGKSRFLKVISDLCFYPIRASGSSSLSGIMRFKERWMGTLLIDESDLKGNQSDPLVKYLNLGFEKDNPFLLTDKNDVTKTQIFDPFGPKLIAMRQPFRDIATEGRCLSFSPDETAREDIPPELPSRYSDEVAELRALIARFTLEHWGEVSEDCMVSCNGMGLEGRLKQMARPLSIILRLFPDGEDRFKNYLNVRQREIKQTRAESWEGGMFNYALQLAVGDEDLISDPEFGKYYFGGKIQAVLPKMIAESLKCSPKAVTRALEGIGMEVRQKRVKIAGDGRSKKARPILVPNKKKWLEITQRYYFSEDGGEVPDCPECLKGPEFNTIQVGISVTDESPGAVFEGSGTIGTIGTQEEERDLNGTHVPGVPLPVETPQEENCFSEPVPTTLHEWLIHYGFSCDFPVDQYVIIPKENRTGLFCFCNGCKEPDRSLPLYWIPGRYHQICQNHYNEMRALCEKEGASNE